MTATAAVTPVGPFTRGSIGIGLYLHDLPVREAIEQLVRQAVLAEDSGWDGASVSEHHGGHRSYLPNPVLASTWMLEATTRVWCGAVPMLLPLRNAALVAEDLAWLAARYPGRVGAGFAPGYNAEDFAGLELRSFARRGQVYEAKLRTLTKTLRGRGHRALRGDPALAAMGETSTVPLVGAAGSNVAARRAANAGIGLLMDSMASDDLLARVGQAYADAGGAGPRVLGRRVWLGEAPRELFAAQLATYQANSPAGSWLRAAGDDALVSGSPAIIVERVMTAVRAAGATALALRVHLPGAPPVVVDRQIRRIGADVLPLLRQAMASG